MRSGAACWAQRSLSFAFADFSNMTGGRGLSFASGARPHQIASSSPEPANGYVYDGIEGSAVNGVILDEGGAELGFFSGAAREDGMAGTHETLDGDEGEWSYEDLGPEVVLERRAGR